MFFRKRLRPLLLAVVISFVFVVFKIGAQPQIVQTGAIQTTPTTQLLADPAAGHGEAHDSGSHDAHHSLPKVLLILILILFVAKVGGDLMERVGQPAVLGELLFGIALGNLALLHIPGMNVFNSYIKDPQVAMFITILSEIGVILLLFEVGLESTVREMVSVGATSFIVAILGVVAPIGLGFGVGRFFLPEEPWTVHLFLGAVMAATSVGITARVLRDLNQMQRRESKIILGAAVIDDILGLVVLAVAQGAVAASNAGGTLEISAILIIIAKAIGFFAGAIILGMLLSRRLFKAATFLRGQGQSSLIAVTLAWCFLVAYLGTLVGVAPIVGAFAAGLVLEDTTFLDWEEGERDLEALLHPITSFLVPVFFVYTGMNVDLRTFANVNILGFAATLTVVAIAAKQICALGVREPSLNRLAIGIGMVPRGEVGLIVANIGRTMKTSEGHPVISSDTFSATVIMVVITTMITPPALKWALDRKPAVDPMV